MTKMRLKKTVLAVVLGGGILLEIFSGGGYF